MFESSFSGIKKITLQEKHVLIALDVQLELWRHSPYKGMKCHKEQSAVTYPECLSLKL